MTCYEQLTNLWTFHVELTFDLPCDTLLIQRQVIKTKSVEFMPFYLSLFTLLASCCWAGYGLLSHDLFIMVCFLSHYMFSRNFHSSNSNLNNHTWQSPNLVGIFLGILQLMVYWKYKGRNVEHTNRWDVENNKDMPKQEQMMEIDNKS